MGCGTSNDVEPKKSVNTAPVPLLSNHSSPEKSSQKSFDEHTHHAVIPKPLTNDATIWLKVNEPMKCSKCGENAQVFSSQANSKEHRYLCTSCAPAPGLSENCPNGHPLIWTCTAYAQQCDVCKENDTSFYTCTLCNYNICTTRCKPKNNVKKVNQCPNGHDLKWLKDSYGNECQACDAKNVPGFLCEIDGYFVCSAKCKKIRNAHYCPNGHNLEWHKVTHGKRCEVCGRRDDQIYECKGCDFTACHYCKEGKDYKVRASGPKVITHNEHYKSPVANTKLNKSRAENQKKIIKNELLNTNSEKEIRISAKINPLRQYENKVKELKYITAQKNEARQSSVTPLKSKLGNHSRVHLAEMSNLVENLLEQNASMQANLENVLNRNQSVGKMGLHENNINSARKQKIGYNMKKGSISRYNKKQVIEVVDY